MTFSGKTKEPECLDFKDFQAPKEQGMRESNSHQRFWRPLSYHLTNPLQSIFYILSKLHTCQHFLKIITSCDSWSSPHPISNSQLHALLHFHLCPIYLVVFKGVYFLTNGISHLKGGFTLRCLQRLSLPDLATLPCRWSTADTPVVRPSRSSRTKDSSSQISYAHAG